MKLLNGQNDALFLSGALAVQEAPAGELVKAGPVRQCESCGREAESYYLDRDDVICVDCFKARRAEEADRDYWKEKARMHLERTERKNWRTR
jgi:hypothetical protein